MQVTLDMGDAMELEQLLEFLAGWMKADRDYLAPSLARYLGTEASASRSRARVPSHWPRTSAGSGSCWAPPTARASSPPTSSDPTVAGPASFRARPRGGARHAGLGRAGRLSRRRDPGRGTANAPGHGGPFT